MIRQKHGCSQLYINDGTWKDEVSIEGDNADERSLPKEDNYEPEEDISDLTKRMTAYNFLKQKIQAIVFHRYVPTSEDGG